jgi:DNA replication protein DnaC
LDRLTGRFDHAGVPDHLRGVTLQTLKRRAGEAVMHSEAVQALRDLAESGVTRDPRNGTQHESLCILGVNGVGKSGLLVMLARQAYRDGRVPLWIKYADLVRDGIQAGYGTRTSEGIELSEIRRQTAQRAHLLCLDDLGDPFAERDRSETADRRDILFRVISARHERGRVTHFTANYDSIGEIARHFDPRIADRIEEMCAVVQLDGPNLRERTSS